MNLDNTLYDQVKKNVQKCLAEVVKKYESKGKKENNISFQKMTLKEAGKGFFAAHVDTI